MVGKARHMGNCYKHKHGSKESEFREKNKDKFLKATASFCNYHCEHFLAQ